MNVAWPHGDPRDVAHRVLAEPGFRNAVARPGEKSWWDYLGEWLAKAYDWLSAPFRRGLSGHGDIASIVGIVVLVAALVFLLVVVVRFARRLRPRHRAPARAAALAFGADADARTLLAHALEAASAGRHNEAAALLWASALRALDERGRVRFDAARTPGEWRREVRDPSFDALARDAVVAMFGQRGADAALVARMRSAYERVVPG